MKKLLPLLLALSLAGTVYAGTREFPIPKEIASSVMRIKKSEVIAEKGSQKSTEDYMELVNTGKKNHTLLAATSPDAEIVQLHEGCLENKKQHMEKISAIGVNAGKDKLLEQGGYHVMLIDTKKELTPGEVVPITLIFKDGSHIDTTTKVVAHNEGLPILQTSIACEKKQAAS
jgi:copper(I)-binding protein